MEVAVDIPEWAEFVISDLTDMDRNPHRVDAAKVSSFRLRLPDDVYFEYAFIDGAGAVRRDPANPLLGENPWYPEVSAVMGPDYAPSPYAALAGRRPDGSIDRHRLESRSLGQMRRLSVYTPAGRDGRELPLVLVQDGVAFLRLAGLPSVLEALLAEGRARPARLVFVEPVDRVREYGFDAGYRDFVMDELLPFLERSYPTDRRVALGASLGGLFSATAALLHPGAFDVLVTFSGAFLGTPERREFYRSEESWLLQRLRAGVPGELRWYLEVGTLEWLTDVNRAVRQVLREAGTDHAYRERHAGHNWTNWRNGLADALAFALPLPGPDGGEPRAGAAS